MSSAEMGSGCVADGSCITCSDQGLVLRIVSVGPDGMALCVADDGREEEVQVDLIDGPSPGDVVLVHARVALQRLGAETARP